MARYWRISGLNVGGGKKYSPPYSCPKALRSSTFFAKQWLPGLFPRTKWHGLALLPILSTAEVKHEYSCTSNYHTFLIWHGVLWKELQLLPP